MRKEKCCKSCLIGKATVELYVKRYIGRNGFLYMIERRDVVIAFLKRVRPANWRSLVKSRGLLFMLVANTSEGDVGIDSR